MVINQLTGLTIMRWLMMVTQNCKIYSGRGPPVLAVGLEMVAIYSDHRCAFHWPFVGIHGVCIWISNLRGGDINCADLHDFDVPEMGLSGKIYRKPSRKPSSNCWSKHGSRSILPFPTCAISASAAQLQRSHKRLDSELCPHRRKTVAP